MRISFQTTDTNQKVDRWKTSEKEAQVQRIGTGNGYTLDISGQLAENEIYKEQRKTVEEVMQEAGTKDVALTRDYMAVMSNSMSDEEFAELQKEGYKVGDMEIKQAVTILDQIKAALLQAGVSVSGYTDTLDMKTLTEITGNEGLAREMSKAFSERNIPLTEETARASMQALKEAQALTQPKEDTLKYMVANQKQPVIEDLYLAQFSSRAEGGRQGRGYFQDENGYLSLRADDAKIESLQPQIQKILEEAGMAELPGAEEAARWLIGEGLPLTQDTLASYMALTRIDLPMEQEELLQSMAVAVADGRTPRWAKLTKEPSLLEQAADIWKRVQHISDEAVDAAAGQGKSLTLQNLEAAQKALTAGYENTDGSNITARRQLEEVRLKMTIAANRELLKSGYAIETAELEQLVEALRNVEKQQNEILFCGKSEQETQLRAQLYTETLKVVSHIPYMPAATVGRVWAVREASGEAAELTLEQVHTEGEALAAAYKKAGEQYETFRTRPDAELGDSIRKAFQNVDDLLKELQLETTDANRRAVRILGYNHLEITEENILTIKAADMTLKNAVDKMTPAAVLKMIRDGKNPLEMTVTELDDYLSGQEQEAEAEQEKFSKFLYKLEQKKEITKEEKESCIGIYRLLRQVEKTDGAVIGSLVFQGAELTFQNLLTAVRTYHSKPINAVVDDELGTVAEVRQEGSRIDEQIARAFVRKIYHGLDGENVLTAIPDMNTELEKAAEWMEAQEINEEAELSYRRWQMEALREAQSVDEDQIKFLQELEEEITPNHLKAADEFRKNFSKAFMKIRKQADTYTDDQKNPFKEVADGLEEHFNSRDEAAAAYKTLAEVEKQILESAIYENPEITAVDVRELGLIYKQVSFTARLADCEKYEIPLVTEDSVTALHLQIVHSEEKKGTVEASMEHLEYGKLSVRLQLQEGKVKGLFVDCRTEKREALSELKQQLQTALKENGFEEYDAAEAKPQTEQMSTGELYRAAKTVICVMRRQAERG